MFRKKDPAKLGSLIDQVHLGDARELLPRIQSATVRLVHTSPPYNIGRPYAGYDDKRGLDAYLDLVRGVVKELERVLVPGGSLFWQSGYTQAEDGSIIPIDHLTWPVFMEMGFRLWDRIIWRYWGGMAFKKKWTNKHETILWWVKPGAEPYFDVFPVREASKMHDPRNNLFGRNPGNVWEVDRVAYGSRDQTSHIAVFPEEVSDRIVLACSREGETCLDPFSGSGTLCATARARGRHYIGTELLQGYFDDSVRRIAQHQKSQECEVLSSLVKSYLNQRGGHARQQDICRMLAELCTLDPWHGLDDISESAKSHLAAGDWEGAESRPIRKERKRALWARLDAFMNDPGAMQPLHVADRAHRASYKLARRFNAAMRVHQAVNWLRWLRSVSESLPEVVEDVVETEASSYSRRGDTIRVGDQPDLVAAVLAPRPGSRADVLGQRVMFSQ